MAFSIDLGDSEEEGEIVDKPVVAKVVAPEGANVDTELLAKAPPALLLPEHVTMGDEDAENGEMAAAENEMAAEDVDMTGIAVVDDNRAAVSSML